MSTIYEDVRPSPLAGRWYPANAMRLRKSIERMLAQAKDCKPNPQVLGLIAPHAGHRYSGPVAAGAFCTVQRMTFDRVVIISPMHHPYLGDIITTDHTAYETPLGIVPVDVSFVAALDERLPLSRVSKDQEHAVEIELPFLQVALDGSFKLVPLMLRDQSFHTVKRLAAALASLLDDQSRTLLVGSSDLSHFYTKEEAHELDRVMLDRIEAYDPEGVLSVNDKAKGFACGRGAIATVLLVAQRLGAEQAQVVAYGTSADAGADRERVVGYGAAIVY